MPAHRRFVGQGTVLVALIVENLTEKYPNRPSAELFSWLLEVLQYPYQTRLDRAICPLWKTKDFENYADVSCTDELVSAQLKRVIHRKIGSFLICTFFASLP
jgi:hypothetical protein